MTEHTPSELLLPVIVLVPASDNNGGLVKFPSGRQMILSKHDGAVLLSQAEAAGREAREPVTVNDLALALYAARPENEGFEPAVGNLSYTKEYVFPARAILEKYHVSPKLAAVSSPSTEGGK